MWRVLLLLTACGRVGFDAHGDGATAGGGDAPTGDGPLATGLLHYWSINDPIGGATVHDVAGADATVMAPATIVGTGRVGNALDSVSGGYAYVPTTPADMAGQTQLTIAAWLRRSAAGGIEQVGEEFAGTPYTDEMSIQLWQDGLLYYCIDAGCSTVATNDTTWHHVVMVFDGTQPTEAARIIGYLDGVLQTTTFGGTTGATTPVRTDLHFDLGSTGHNEGRDDGVIDEVRVYNFAFAPADVAALFASYN